MVSTWQRVSRLYRVLIASHLTKLVSVCLSRCWHTEAHFTRPRRCEPRLGFVIPVPRQTIWYLCCRRVPSRSRGNQRVRSLFSISSLIKGVCFARTETCLVVVRFTDLILFKAKARLNLKGNHVLVSPHSIYLVQQSWLKNYISGSYLYQITGDPKFADRVGLTKTFFFASRKPYQKFSKKGRENHL